MNLLKNELGGRTIKMESNSSVSGAQHDPDLANALNQPKQDAGDAFNRTVTKTTPVSNSPKSNDSGFSEQGSGELSPTVSKQKISRFVVTPVKTVQKPDATATQFDATTINKVCNSIDCISTISGKKRYKVTKNIDKLVEFALQLPKQSDQELPTKVVDLLHATEVKIAPRLSGLNTPLEDAYSLKSLSPIDVRDLTHTLAAFYMIQGNRDDAQSCLQQGINLLIDFEAPRTELESTRNQFLK